MPETTRPFAEDMLAGSNTASWVYTLHPGLDADGIVDTDTYTTTHIGEALLEDFTYTATDKAGNVAEAHLYIRLGDGAPAFPNTGGTDEGIFSVVDGTLATFMDAAAVPGTEAAHTLPEPVEVALANVPLPYDVDATQHI